MAGLAQGACQRHQLYGQGLLEATGCFFQYLYGHAARGSLVGANDIRGDLGCKDHDGVGLSASEEGGAEQQEQNGNAHKRPDPG